MDFGAFKKYILFPVHATYCWYFHEYAKRQNATKPFLILYYIDRFYRRKFWIENLAK